MKVLVVGGTGLIGGHAAWQLQQQGHDVTVAARKPPASGTPMAAMPFIAGDYLGDGLGVAQLRGFEALVFAAGNDIRHLPPGIDEAEHWQRANVEGVPTFFRRAREAGIRRAVHIGSFYPQAAPQLVERSSYVHGRLRADEGARSCNTADFQVCSLNAPFVAGTVPGLTVPSLAAHAAYALGRIPQVPPFAMPGAVNFMSTRSLSEAVIGALARGEPGRAYLVGDENLSFHDYFSEYFRAAGHREPLPLIDRNHPMLPDIALYAGRGGSVCYEPDPAEVQKLGYRRGDVRRTLQEIVDFYR